MNSTDILNKEIKKNLRHWKEIVAKYQVPNTKKAIVQMCTTFLPFIALWVLMYFSLSWSIFITIALGIINAFFMVRIFIIQHDCGHQSFLGNKNINDVIGYICSLFSTIPYTYWAKMHNYHHAHSGMLEVRDIGDIPTMTVNEYRESKWYSKLGYRIFRFPLVTFVIAPVYYLVYSNRVPIETLGNWKKMFGSQFRNNIVIVCSYLLMGHFFGWKEFLFVQLFIIFIFGIIAFWFFYVQHQHEESYKEWQANWNYVAAALKGSTHYKLPRIFQWLTGNIGIHHIHHLSSLIPNYNLESCMKENVILNKYTTVITFWESLKLMTHKLWDEEQKRMISFAEYYRFERLRMASISN